MPIIFDDELTPSGSNPPSGIILDDQLEPTQPQQQSMWDSTVTWPNAVRMAGSTAADYLGALSAPFTAGLGYPAISFAGGALSEGIARAMEGQPFNPYIMATEGALNLIPGPKIPGRGAALGEIAKYGAKQVGYGAAQGLGGAYPRYVAETGDWTGPSLGEYGAQTAMGGVVGGATGLGLAGGKRGLESIGHTAAAPPPIAPPTPTPNPYMTSVSLETYQPGQMDLLNNVPAGPQPIQPFNQPSLFEPRPLNLQRGSPFEPNQPYSELRQPQLPGMELQGDLFGGQQSEYPLPYVPPELRPPSGGAGGGIPPSGPTIPPSGGGPELPATVTVKNAAEAKAAREQGYVPQQGLRDSEGYPMMVLSKYADLYVNRPPNAPPPPPSVPPTVRTNAPSAIGPNEAVAGQPITVPIDRATDVFIEKMAKNGYKETSRSSIGVTFKKLLLGEEGTFDPQEMWANLKRLFGRDPTPDEVQRGMDRQVSEGETRGRVAPFPPPEILAMRQGDLLNTPENQRPPVEDRIRATGEPFLREGEGLPPTWGMTLDELESSRALSPGGRYDPMRNYIGEAVPGIDKPRPPQMGQQDLPLGPISRVPRPSEPPREGTSYLDLSPLPTQQKLPGGYDTFGGIRKIDPETGKLYPTHGAADELNPIKARQRDIEERYQRDGFARDKYRLPDGTIVPVDATATKGAQTSDFTMRGGKIVKMEYVGPLGPNDKIDMKTGRVVEDKSRSDATKARRELEDLAQEVSEFLEDGGVPTGLIEDIKRRLMDAKDTPTALRNLSDIRAHMDSAVNPTAKNIFEQLYQIAFYKYHEIIKATDSGLPTTLSGIFNQLRKLDNERGPGVNEKIDRLMAEFERQINGVNDPKLAKLNFDRFDKRVEDAVNKSVDEYQVERLIELRDIAYKRYQELVPTIKHDVPDTINLNTMEREKFGAQLRDSLGEGRAHTRGQLDLPLGAMETGKIDVFFSRGPNSGSKIQTFDSVAAAEDFINHHPQGNKLDYGPHDTSFDKVYPAPLEDSTLLDAMYNKSRQQKLPLEPEFGYDLGGTGKKIPPISGGSGDRPRNELGQYITDKEADKIIKDALNKEDVVTPEMRDLDGTTKKRVWSETLKRFINDDTGAMPVDDNPIVKLFRKGLKAVKDFEYARFILPDGTKLGHDKLDSHYTIAEELGINLENAYDAGIVRIREDSAQVFSPITYEQATQIADITSLGRQQSVFIDVTGTDGKTHSREFLTGRTRPDTIRNWVNYFFKDESGEFDWDALKSGMKQIAGIIRGNGSVETRVHDWSIKTTGNLHDPFGPVSASQRFTYDPNTKILHWTGVPSLDDTITAQTYLENQGLEIRGHYPDPNNRWDRTHYKWIKDESGEFRPTELWENVKEKTGWGQGATKGSKQDPNETNLIKEALAVPTNATTMLDLSAPGRQGITQIMTKDFWIAASKMFQGLSSKGFDQIDAELRNKPIFQEKIDTNTGDEIPSFASQIGMKLYSPASKPGPRAEATASRWLEGLPLVGGPIRASNRAYITFLNHLNANRTELLLNRARDMSIRGLETGRTAMPGILGGIQLSGGRNIGFTQKVTQEQAMDLNPFHNMMLAKEIADFVNTATGHGPLKTHLLPFKQAEVSLEKAAGLLSATLFSPGQLFSRIRLMNPNTYIMASPYVRKQYLKAALSTASAWFIFTELAKQAGGSDVEVSNDLTSADFGKVRIGNTRLDPGAGFLQFLTAYGRMYQGGSTSSASGEFHRFGSGYQAQTQEDMMERFIVNKLNPVTKFAYDMLSASEYNPFHVGDRTVQLFIPLIIQDINEIRKEDPTLLPYLVPPTAFGMGTQIYSKGESVGKIIEPENDWLTTGGGLRDLIGQGPYQQ